MQELEPTISSGMAAHGLLALFGGIAHAINAHRKGESKTVFDFMMLTALSSFSGVLFALIALYMFDNSYVTLAAAGSGGFLGVEGLALITDKVRELISKK